MIRTGLIAIPLVLSPCAASAQLVDENLLVAPPAGYVPAFQNRSGNAAIMEFVPQGETVDNWTEMVTVEILFGQRALVPKKFRSDMDKVWSRSCPGTQPSELLSDKPVNGYASQLWTMVCPLNPKTQKPEHTFFKAIAGNDSFYIVQKAFKSAPTAEQAKFWTAYLTSVSVCDSRLSKQACPTDLQKVR